MYVDMYIKVYKNCQETIKMVVAEKNNGYLKKKITTRYYLLKDKCLLKQPVHILLILSLV